MLSLAQTLSYYKREDVRKLILEHSRNKEIGVRFNDSFGKRPDILQYDNDILEFAKKGVTSFHCSEETWSNPLQLDANLKKQELDELRTGWDLILDIDCPYWELAKLITYVFIKAIKDHKVDSVTVKFSGSKGFHIAVPFESFPKNIIVFNQEAKKPITIDIKDIFPDGPRRIAAYLLDYAEKNLIQIDPNSRTISFCKAKLGYDKFMQFTGKKDTELMIKVCAKCKKTITADINPASEFICPKCESSIRSNEKFMQCPKCKILMERKDAKKAVCKCGSDSYEEKLDLGQIVAIDTVLISSRHLYRMPYSLHEKSGLVSVPFDIKHILRFEKEEARPSKFEPFCFLDRNIKESEARMLFEKAFEFGAGKKDRDDYKDFVRKEYVVEGVFADAEAVPEAFFPPCIQKISKGVEDGKKRALFIMINFLASCSWPYDKIEEYVNKWNSLNKPDRLRDTYITGQLRYYKAQKKALPPPNCDNRAYMIDTQFCNPDELCKKIKNPAQYAKRKAYLSSMNAPKKRGRAAKNIREDK
jgi:hypothetical protein